MAILKYYKILARTCKKSSKIVLFLQDCARTWQDLTIILQRSYIDLTRTCQDSIYILIYISTLSLVLKSVFSFHCNVNLGFCLITGHKWLSSCFWWLRLWRKCWMVLNDAVYCRPAPLNLWHTKYFHQACGNCLLQKKMKGMDW